MHLACLNPGGHCPHLVKISTLDMGAQAIERSVGNRYSIIDRFVGDEAQDRAKYFLLSNVQIRVHFREHRGPGMRGTFQSRVEARRCS